MEASGKSALELFPVAYGGGARYSGCEGAPDALLALGVEAACRRNGHHVSRSATLHPGAGERWAMLAALLRTHCRTGRAQHFARAHAHSHRWRPQHCRRLPGEVSAMHCMHRPVSSG